MCSQSIKYEAIVQKASRFLADLGDTEQDVADYLLAYGYLGIPGRSRNCPIQKYLQTNLEKGVTYKTHTTFSTGFVVKHPEAVRKFIGSFDEMKYPALIAP